MLKLIAAGLVGLMCTALVIAQPQEPPNTVAALNDAAIKAYQAKDYARFLDYERRALALEPQNPRTMYNVACGEALTGHAEAAVQALNSLAARKLDLGAEKDDDFATIRSSGWLPRRRLPRHRSHATTADRQHVSDAADDELSERRESDGRRISGRVRLRSAIGQAWAEGDAR